MPGSSVCRGLIIPAWQDPGACSSHESSAANSPPPASYKRMSGRAGLSALIFATTRNSQPSDSTRRSHIVVMKNLTAKSLGFIPAALCLLLALLATNAKAQSLYWDINGATAGAGGATPSGSWEAPNWSTDPTGASATGNWVEGGVPE